MYTMLSKALLRTRESFTSVCKQLGINPSLPDMELLTVVPCDNCGFWDIPKNMDKDKDESYYCTACCEADYYEQHQN